MGFENNTVDTKNFSEISPGEGRDFQFKDLVLSALEAEVSRVKEKVENNNDSGRNLELAEESYSSETIQVGSYTVELIGVAHIAETIYLKRDEIERAIRGSQYTVIENGVRFLDNQRVYNRIEDEDLEPATDFSLGQELRMIVPPNGENDFFQTVSTIAGTYQKPLVIFDPMGDERIFEKGQDWYQDQIENHELYKKSASDIMSMVTVASGGALAYNMVRELSDKQATRRDFLRSTALLGIGLSLSLRAWLNGGSDIDDPVPLRYELLADFRDACVALGLLQMESIAKESANIALVYGAAHIRGIKYYLEHPDVARAKIDILYREIQSTAPAMTTAYEYTFTPGDLKKDTEGHIMAQSIGKWEKTIEVKTKI
jgi:hypothetical protein